MPNSDAFLTSFSGFQGQHGWPAPGSRLEENKLKSQPVQRNLVSALASFGGSGQMIRESFMQMTFVNKILRYWTCVMLMTVIFFSVAFVYLGKPFLYEFFLLNVEALVQLGTSMGQSAAHVTLQSDVRKHVENGASLVGC
jgi:hypothetical protein